MEASKELVKKPEEETILMPLKASMFFHVAKFELAQRVAKVFASSTMVPTHFQNNIGNCLIALNLAERMDVDPFMLMQNMYIIHGKPAIEAKLAIAALNSSGKFSPLEYHMENENTESWSCVAYAHRKDSKEKLLGPKVSLAMAKAEGWTSKQGSKWKTLPELMLKYRSAMFFIRTYAPEVMLGMQSREEVWDTVDLEAHEYSFKPDMKSKVEKIIAEPEPEIVEEPQVEEDDEVNLFWHLKEIGFKRNLPAFLQKYPDWPGNVQARFNEKYKRIMNKEFGSIPDPEQDIEPETPSEREPWNSDQHQEIAAIVETKFGGFPRLFEWCLATGRAFETGVPGGLVTRLYEDAADQILADVDGAKAEMLDWFQSQGIKD